MGASYSKVIVALYLTVLQLYAIVDGAAVIVVGKVTSQLSIALIIILN